MRSCVIALNASIALRCTPALLGGGLRLSRRSATSTSAAAAPPTARGAPASAPGKASPEADTQTKLTESALPPRGAERSSKPTAQFAPQEALDSLLQRIASQQQIFLFGEDGTQRKGGSLASQNSFFSLVNSCYEGRILQEQQKEVELYVAKRRAHYEQRLTEGTEEFRREQREVLDEAQRKDCEKYKKELANDVKEFTAGRQKEYEERLQEDIYKYSSALRSTRRSPPKKEATKGDKTSARSLEENLSTDGRSLAESFDDADSADDEDGVCELTEEDVRMYVEQRLLLYESALESELDEFTRRRKAFYEDLLDARANRHAAKVRTSTDEFRAQRQRVYEDYLGQDAMWMAKAFQAHYEACFLQCYARQAWLKYRHGSTFNGKQQVGKDANYDGHGADLFSTITMSSLEKEVPLSSVVQTFEKETISEVSRDVFLKAARRIAEEGPLHDDATVKTPLSDNATPTPR